MTDNELLVAIVQIMDKKIEPLKKDTDQKFKDLKKDMMARDREIDNKLEEIKREIVAVKIDIENDVKPSISILAENYWLAAKRFESATNRIETLEMEMDLGHEIFRK